MKVSVIIVSYNTRALTLSCISSIITMTDGIDYEIIVVDNNSTDGSADAIAEEFRDVTVIREPLNRGFGKANNIGVSKAQGEYVFFLNSDTVLMNNAISLFSEYLDDPANEKTGAVGAVLYSADMARAVSYGDFHRLVPCMKGKMLELAIRSMKRIVPNVYCIIRNRLHEARDNSAKYPLEVQCISGADLFVRRSVLERAGLFDERYFLYSEEVDLQCRIARAGFLRMIIDTPMIAHFESKSFTVTNSKRMMMNVSRLLYFRINHGAFSFMSFYLFTLFMSIVEFALDFLLWEYSPLQNLSLICHVMRVKYPVREW